MTLDLLTLEAEYERQVDRNIFLSQKRRLTMDERKEFERGKEVAKELSALISVGRLAENRNTVGEIKLWKYEPMKHGDYEYTCGAQTLQGKPCRRGVSKSGDLCREHFLNQ